jgi:hypothetical protein
MELRPTVQMIVWFLNIMNTACAFPSIWVLLPVRPKQHQLLSSLCCSLVITTVYALAKHLAVLFFRSSSRSPWIWVVAVSPAHLWCAVLCLMVRQEIRQSRTEHLEKSSAEKPRGNPDYWWRSDSGSTALCLIPAAIFDSVTSAAMLLFEKEFHEPLPQGWTPLLQVAMECFTLSMFIGCRYAEHIILWSEDRKLSNPSRGYDIVIGSIGVLSLFVVRSLCDALMPASGTV